MLRSSVNRGLLVVLMWLTATSRVGAQESESKRCATLPVVTDVSDAGAVALRAEQLRAALPATSLAFRRPSSERMLLACDSLRTDFAPLPVRLQTTYNSAYPVDVNNGAVWSGRGLSAAVRAGAEIKWGRLSAGLYPVATFQQNASFRTAVQNDPQYSPYAYTAHLIDWPQRFGESSYATVDLGQSYIRVDVAGIAAGVSTENLWLGPALRMPLLLGNSAPGFPHAFIATSKPVDIRIGVAEAQAFTGRLTESEYFDNDASNDHRVLAGLTLVFEPAFARGLFIGGNRLFSTFEDGIASYAFDPYVDVRGNPSGSNQMLSLFARWAHPAAGFEAYAEWAREDAWGAWIDLLREPDHGQAYMLGFQKTGSWRGGDLRWYGELAHLIAASPLRGGRGIVTLYTHFEIIQGQTQRGQLLGAWIGPGSDAQILGVEHTRGDRSTALSIERVRYDDDAYYNLWARFYGQNGHDVSIGATVEHGERIFGVDMRATLGLARRQNRNFVYFTGAQPPDLRWETNARLELDARWTPR